MFRKLLLLFKERRMNKRMDTLQALRFLACLCIFAHHCYIIEFVYWGVSVFFVLSGFLMAYNYYGRPAMSLSPLASLRFSIGKIGKLYPLHILALLPVLALNIYFRESNGTDWANIVTSVVYNLLLIQAWSQDYAVSLNGVAWYLSVCLFLYFMFPYVLSCIRSYRSRKTAFVAVIALYCAEFALAFAAAPISRQLYGDTQAAAQFTSWFGYIFPIFRFFDFAIGCNLGYIFLTRSEGESEGRGACALLNLGCVALFIAAIYIYSSDLFLARKEFSSGVIVLPFSAAMVYLFAVGKGIIPRLFTNRATVFLGNLSAYFFLIHQDFVRLCYMLLDRLGLSVSQCKPILFFGCGALAVAASAAYDKLDRALRKRTKNRALQN